MGATGESPGVIEGRFEDGLGERPEEPEAEPSPDDPRIARAHAMAVFSTMPSFWKERFVAIYREFGQSRRARRAVSKVLRQYNAWQKAAAERRQFQAADKERRNQILSAKLFDRHVLGKPPLRGVSAEVIQRIEAGGHWANIVPEEPCPVAT